MFVRYKYGTGSAFSSKAYLDVASLPSKMSPGTAEKHEFCKIRDLSVNKVPDENELIMATTNEDEKNYSQRRQIWFSSVKPWCAGVAGSAFFLMSLYQTCSFLVKYFSGPIITIVDLQSITPKDMPWITICPEPGYSVVEMNKYRGILFPEDDWTSWTGIDPMLFGQIHNKTDLTIDEWLNDIALPILTNETTVSVLNPDGLRYDAVFSSGMWNEQGHINVSLDKPVIHESSVGQWETRLVGMYQRGFQFCTTWKPNITFHGVQLALSLNLRRNFYVHDMPSEVMETIDHHFLPTFWMYGSQPHEPLDTYTFATFLGGTGFRHLKVGRTELAKFQVNSEKFQMLNTISSACSTDAGVVNSSMQCRTKCLESTFMNKACRLPGYREDTPLSRISLLPPVCKTPEDYADWNSLHWDKSGRDAFKRCQSECLRSCTRMQYDWIDLAGSDGETHEHKEFADMWDDPRTRISEFVLQVPNKNQKVTTQEYAYGTQQLLSELGGSWGLFLGVSFVHVLIGLEWLLLQFL